MADPKNRAIHPELAAKEVFKKDFDDNFEAFYRDSQKPGHPYNELYTHSLQIYKKWKGNANGHDRFLRELLSMSMAHSKSKVPREFLSPERSEDFRNLMVTTISKNEEYHRLSASIAKLEKDLKKQDNPAKRLELARLNAELKVQQRIMDENFHRSYSSQEEAFAWLKPEEMAKTPELRTFWQDVIAVEKALSIADVSRQRQTRLRTSNGNQVVPFEDGTSVIILDDPQNPQSPLYMRSSDPIHAGEANISESTLLPNGDYKVAITRTDYSSERQNDGVSPLERIQRAVSMVIKDIANDAMILGDSQKLVIELPHGTPKSFEESLAQDLSSTPYGNRVVFQRSGISRPKPTLESKLLSDTGKAKDISSLGHEQRAEVSNALFQKCKECPLEEVLRSSKVLSLNPGETFIKEKEAAEYAYLVLGPNGIEVIRPGYSSLSLPGRSLIGEAALIRGDVRNAEVRAGSAGAQVLAIPKDVYLKHMLRIDEPESIATQVRQRTGILSNFDLPGGKTVHMKFVPPAEVRSRADTGNTIVALDYPQAKGEDDHQIRVFDHHAQYRDPSNPYANTTTKIIDAYEESHKNLPAGETNREAFIRELLDVRGANTELPREVLLSSDNIFDTEMAIALINRPELLRDPEQRKILREAALIHDFVHFGDMPQGLDSKANLLSKALYQNGDRLIQKHAQYFMGDRIKPDTPEHVQRQIFDELHQSTKNITQSVLNGDDTVKNDVAKYERTIATEADRISREAIVSANHDWLKELDTGDVGKKFFEQVAVVDANKLNTGTPHPGLTWGASNQSHNKNVAVRIEQRNDGSVGFFITTPYGRQLPAFLDSGLADALRALHRKNTGNDQPNLVGFREDGLIFSFAGIKATPQQVLKVIQDYYKQKTPG